MNKELNEYKAAKVKLENNISSAVGSLIAGFVGDTGLYPLDIRLRTVRVDEIGKEKPYFLIIGVSVEIDL